MIDTIEAIRQLQNAKTLEDIHETIRKYLRDSSRSEVGDSMEQALLRVERLENKDGA